MNKYHHVLPIERHDAETIFLSNDVEKTCEAMVSVSFYEKDWKWAQDKFLTFLFNNNPIISGLAATCLGHIARIHGQLEKVKVFKALHDRLNDLRIAGQIQDAISDIEMFTGQSKGKKD